MTQHRELFKRIGSLEGKSEGADSYLALDVDKEIRMWWEKHIMKSDMAFVPYIKKIG